MDPFVVFRALELSLDFMKPRQPKKIKYRHIDTDQTQTKHSEKERQTNLKNAYIYQLNNKTQVITYPQRLLALKFLQPKWPTKKDTNTNTDKTQRQREKKHRQNTETKRGKTQTKTQRQREKDEFTKMHKYI